VIAAVVRLLDRGHMRVGNEQYARDNKSFGATTLRSRHVKRNGSKLLMRFTGKHGIVHDVKVTDRRLARVVRRCRDIPGQELFQFVDDAGQRHTIGSADVNAYLHEATGEDFTAKDFRTWTATLLAASLLCGEPRARSARGRKQQVLRAIERMLYLNVIHGDLSAYNLLVWDGRVTVIDLPQAIDPRKNRHAHALLERDVRRICEHFERLGVRSSPGRLAADLWTAWQFADLVPEELRTGLEI